MRTKYLIDRNRVYICGVSGGGRVASMLGVAFPELFKGGYYIVGCNFYRDEPSPEAGRVYPRAYKQPPATIYNQARSESRHVFLTGDGDFNREQTKVYFEAFRRDGFKRCAYLEVPGMGHRAPDAEWFEKGLIALDPQSAQSGVPALVPPPQGAVRPRQR